MIAKQRYLTMNHPRACLDVVTLKIQDSVYISVIGFLLTIDHRTIDHAFVLFPRKRLFLYSAVSSPLDRSKRFTLFIPWQTCSFRHQLDFSGTYSSHAFPLLCVLPVARYSCIQLSELGRHGALE